MRNPPVQLACAAIAFAMSVSVGPPTVVAQTEEAETAVVTPTTDHTAEAAAAPADDAAEAAAAPAPDAEPAASARQRIEVLNDGLLDILRRSNELDYDQRFDALAPTLAATFDLPYMARQVVGRGFLKLEETSRQRWYELFATYMTANYASRFDHFSNQSFEILSEEPSAKETVLIRTQVIDPGHENVELTYRLREGEDGWRVIDVFLRGTVSEIALRRSEYASVLKRDGFDALVASIEERIAKLAAAASD